VQVKGGQAMNKSLQIFVSIFVSCYTAQSAAFAINNNGADDANKKYVNGVLKLARSGAKKDYLEQDSTGEEMTCVWQLLNKQDLVALINDVDKKALADYQKQNFKAASDRLYCGLDCAAMFSRSLAWGNGHLEGVELDQAKPLTWLDSFAQMNPEVEDLTCEKASNFEANPYIAAVNNYAYYLQLQGKHAEVIPVFQKIIELDPERTVAYLNLADSLWAVGEKNQARKRYSEYVCLCQKQNYEVVPARAKQRFIASAQTESNSNR
jgi:tetratricopeptide (TPR) repeat protein